MERHSFRIDLGKLPKTMQKLCLFTKFRHEEIRWNYVILCNVPAKNSIEFLIHLCEWFTFYKETRTLYVEKIKFAKSCKEILSCHCIKNVRIRSFSGLFFWKIRTRKTSNTDTFYAVCITEAYSEPCQTFKMKRSVNIVKVFNYFYKTLHLRCLTRLWIRLCICKILTIEPQGLSKEPPYEQVPLAAEMMNTFCKQLNLLLYS